jgi:hypothetical protein
MAFRKKGPPSVWATRRAPGTNKRKQHYLQYNTSNSVKPVLSCDPRISTTDLDRRRFTRVFTKARRDG